MFAIDLGLTLIAIPVPFPSIRHYDAIGCGLDHPPDLFAPDWIVLPAMTQAASFRWWVIGGVSVQFVVFDSQQNLSFTLFGSSGEFSIYAPGPSIGIYAPVSPLCPTPSLVLVVTALAPPDYHL